jgi:hypothetical protein
MRLTTTAHVKRDRRFFVELDLGRSSQARLRRLEGARGVIFGS